MLDWLLPALPAPTLIAFAVLAVAPVALSPRAIEGVALAAGGLTLLMVIPFALACRPDDCTVGPVAVTATPRIGDIDHALGVVLDPLALVTVATVAFVALMVTSAAIPAMRDKARADCRRFFALMALFEAAMLTLVIAADAVVLFLGWELVGLCSFFLIAHDTRSATALAAARKAFVMTRIADAALFAGLALLFVDNDTIQLARMTDGIAAEPDMQDKVALALILVGALGKSAQLPLQTWLPDAMAGPAPVSALLHSATMVAAGVYLLARVAPATETVPAIGWATTALGLATVLVGGLAALAQTDVKRLLAYSTISQIGYMIAAVGAGAPGAAVAHFAVHAAFKSLLFLAAGRLSEAAGHSRDLADLAGSRRRAPLAFWALAAGTVSLAGLPFLSAGWFSKEAILAGLFEAGRLGPALWAGALLGAVLTAAYALRLLAGVARAPSEAAGRVLPDERHGPVSAIALPFAALSAIALAGGLGVDRLVRLVAGERAHHAPEGMLVAAGVGAVVLGALLAALVSRPAFQASAAAGAMRGGLGIDALYRRRVVTPGSTAIARLAPDPLAGTVTRVPAVGMTRAAAHLARDPLGRAVDIAPSAMRPSRATLGDVTDRPVTAIARAVGNLAQAARSLQTGRARDYAAAIVLGAALLLGLAVMIPWR